MSSTAIILGSSRSDGNTAKITKVLADKIDAKIIDLNKNTILPYDYEFENRDDDFLTLIEQLMTYDNWVFASPVYWYAPSSTMKVFVDRLCDLLEIYKTKGRQLANKSAAVLATGAAASPVDCFEPMFSKTFDYFDMNYLGMLYCAFEQTSTQKQHNLVINKFVQQHFSDATCSLV